MDFDIQNPSFAEVEVHKIDIYDTRNKLVKMKSKSLPAIIERYGNKRVLVKYEMGNFKDVEVKARALYKSQTVRIPIN